MARHELNVETVLVGDSSFSWAAGLVGGGGWAGGCELVGWSVRRGGARRAA